MASSDRPNEEAHQDIYNAGIVLRRKVMVRHSLSFETVVTRIGLLALG